MDNGLIIAGVVVATGATLLGKTGTDVTRTVLGGAVLGTALFGIATLGADGQRIAILATATVAATSLALNGQRLFGRAGAAVQAGTAGSATQKQAIANLGAILQGQPYTPVSPSSSSVSPDGVGGHVQAFVPQTYATPVNPDPIVAGATGYGSLAHTLG